MPTSSGQNKGATMTVHRFAWLPICLALAAAGSAAAQNPGPPPGAGQTIQSLASELAALTARVAKLEGQILPADLAGTYAVRGIQVELRASNNNAAPQVASYVFVGTAVLSADGSATFNVSENGSKLPFGTLSVAPHVGSDAFTTTWSYDNGVVTIAGVPMSAAAGGRVLVGAMANHADGTDVLLLLTRLQ